MFDSQKFSALRAVRYILLNLFVLWHVYQVIYTLYKVVCVRLPIIVNFLIIADILLYEIDTNYQVVGKFLFNAKVH